MMTTEEWNDKPAGAGRTAMTANPFAALLDGVRVYQWPDFDEPNPDGRGDWFHRDDVLAAIAALPAVTVGVKPLVWAEDFADHPFGWYETIDCGDCIVLTQSGVTVGPFPTTDAAKAAAQADYEARILAALAAADVLDAREVALEALLREARTDLAYYVDTDWPEVMRLQYPDMQRKYDRDMELCRRIDALLDKEKPHE